MTLQKPQATRKADKEISERHKFEFDLHAILSSLIYTRSLFLGSKLSTFELSKKFLEKQNYELHHIYRALEVLAKESTAIQKHLYHQSAKVVKRDNRILYYDCTNYYFETNEADGLK